MLDTLMNGLSAAGHVLDMPRSALYAGVINPAYHALGGDPNRQVSHFADLLGAAGMDQDSLLTKGLGVAGDIATDPLTWAGLGAAKYARGLLPAHDTMDLGRAAAGASSLAEQGGFKEALQDVPKLTEAALAPAAGDAAGSVRSFGATDLLTSPEVGGKQLSGVLKRGRGIPTDELLERSGQVAQDQMSAGTSFAQRANPTDAAGFSPRGKMVLIGPEGAQGAAGRRVAERHETVHALINDAARGLTEGNAAAADGLPWAMRAPAKMMASDSPFLQTLGSVGDEAAATALGHRGTAAQLKGAASILFNPEANAFYAANQIGGEGASPLALALYKSLPAAFVGAGGAAGGGAGALGRALEGQ